MRIDQVRSFQPIAPNSPPDWRTSLGQVAVRISTSEGLIGYGVGGGGAAGRHVIDSVLAPLICGRSIENALAVERLWEEMYAATLPFGRKGIAIMAISGVDLALWDLRAKAGHRTVADLLGGAKLDSIPVYSTVWNEEEALTVSAEGSGRGAVKLHLGAIAGGRDLRAVVRAITRVREILGPDRRLMVDAWMRWDVDFTLRVADRIEPLRVDWIEEPLSPDDLRGYEQLSGRCPIPIAGGEHEFTAAAFRPLIEQRLHSVVQPDICWVGGLTELVKIYQLAEANRVRVVPHRGAEVWGLHAIAALDRDPLAESGRPWMTWVQGQPKITGDKISLPKGPGFGVMLDECDCC